MLRFNHRKRTWEVFSGVLFDIWAPVSIQYARDLVDQGFGVVVEETVV